MAKPEIKRVVRLSSVMERARKEFEEMGLNPELDASFFSDDELKHYVGVLIKSHAEDWLVINDCGDEGAV